MKKLEIEQMENAVGGSFIAGFCAGVSVVRFGAALGIFALNPAVAGVMLGVVGGCLAYGIYNGLS